METLDYVKAIKAVVKGEFEDAAAAFNDRPTGDNWGRLEAAMWARQAISSNDTMDKAVQVLPKIGVGFWIKNLRDIHEDKKPTKETTS